MYPFKKKCLLELKKAKASCPSGEAPIVSKVATKRRGWPLLLGKLDREIQHTYIKAQALLSAYLFRGGSRI